MPYTDFLGWQEYFTRRPVGWREDMRAYKLLSFLGMKEKKENVFETLEMMSISVKKSRKIETNIENSALYHFMQNAKGGIVLPLE